MTLRGRLLLETFHSRCLEGNPLGDPVRVTAVPEDLQKAFARNKTAKAIFAMMSYTHQKEYVGCIEKAKKPETRARRIERTIKMLREGKKK
jgi:uncharacterized protein YdeI (YjbR/CyaY-like superfamily)